jgi:hypothetical protein
LISCMWGSRCGCTVRSRECMTLDGVRVIVELYDDVIIQSFQVAKVHSPCGSYKHFYCATTFSSSSIGLFSSFPFAIPVSSSTVPATDNLVITILQITINATNITVRISSLFIIRAWRFFTKTTSRTVGKARARVVKMEKNLLVITFD